MDKLVEGKDYTLIDGTLKINEGVKHIPDSSFSNNSDICNLILPSTLISIGSCAFSSCYNLAGTLIIPDSVKYIMSDAFRCCALNKLILGENLTFIGEKAFYWNSLIEVINNSCKLKLICKYAFTNNTKLYNNEFSINNKYVYIAYGEFEEKRDDFYINNTSSVRIIDMYFDKLNENYSNSDNYVCNYKTKDKYTFYDGTLTINDGVEVIGDFSKLDGITNVIMPDSVIMVLPGSFSNLEKLKHVRFSNNLLAIMDEAFYGCSLTKNANILPNSLCLFSLGSFKRNNGNNKIIIPLITDIFGQSDASDFPYERSKSIDDNCVSIYILNIDELIEKDRTLLESLSLLPDTIKLNMSINDNATKFQSNSMKRAFTEILMNNDYNEKNSIDLIHSILKSKSFRLDDADMIVDRLFTKGQINTIYLLMSYGYNYLDNCMISKAIINNMQEMIDVLLLLGADINETGCIEATPLSIACIKGNLDLVKYLIEKGAAINMVDMHNKMAIDYAIKGSNQEIIDLLNSYNKQDEHTTEDDINAVKLLLGN